MARPGAETWVLHATVEWPEQHLEDAPERVASKLIDAFMGWGAPAPDTWSIHRWRFADSHPPLRQGCVWDPARNISLCGDWLHGDTVEGAWLSGQALAQVMQSGITQARLSPD